MLRPGVWLAWGVIVAGIGIGSAGGADRPLRVFVTVPPIQYLAERVGSRHVDVHLLAQAGQDPHTFEPTPRQILAVAKAELLLVVGMPFEQRLAEKIQGTSRQLTVVDVCRGIKKRQLETPCSQGHGHQCHHHHHAAEPDPHVWLSPPLAKVLAANVADALAEVDPAHAEYYQSELIALQRDLDATHAKISEVLGPYKGRSFYVFHPAFGYFGDTYGLRQQAVETGGKLPSPRQLRALVKKAKAEDVRILFVQPQYDQRTAQVVAGLIGGATVPVDPLGRDLLRSFQDIAAKVDTSLRGPKQQ